MSSMMYPRLALSNIRKNSRIYVPYIITCVFTVTVFTLMKSLSLNSDVREISGSVAEVLGLGSSVIAIFSCIFLFYTNSFLMKKRKKEFGLFNILGMEKKHIALLNAYENLVCALTGISAGMITAFVLEKLMYLLLARIISASSVPEYQLSGSSYLSSLIFFAVLFMFIYLDSVWIIYRTKTIELLQSDHSGEREPKSKWLIALLGLVSLGAGYWMAVSVNNAVEAVSMFFTAVLLVIAGTYMLFISGSITLLKCLKKNRNYYYKTSHFTSVSGMIYRMKQNAAGLSNICILSTMVLIVISTTVSLMVGSDSIVKKQCPDNYMIQIDYTVTDGEDEIRKLAAEENVNIKNFQKYNIFLFLCSIEDGTVNFSKGLDSGEYYQLGMAAAVTAEDYRNVFGEEFSVSENEVYLLSGSKKINCSTLSAGDLKFDVKGFAYDKSVSMKEYENIVSDMTYIIMSDMEAVEKLHDEQIKFCGDNAADILANMSFDTDADTETQLALCERLFEYQNETDKYMTFDNQALAKLEANELYGGLFFIGIFLGLMFAAATVIIIYYKQISEGMDDRNRFEIMQKVGMDRDEIKKSINAQVLTVFFLPLCLAGVHVSFAFPMIRRIMAILGLTDTPLFIKCTAVCFAVFAVLYGIVYRLTSVTYYKIVSE